MKKRAAIFLSLALLAPALAAQWTVNPLARLGVESALFLLRRHP